MALLTYYYSPTVSTYDYLLAQGRYLMKELEQYRRSLTSSLHKISSKEKAQASRRYFPLGFNGIGANAADIKLIIATFQQDNAELSADEMLVITEYLLKNSHYSEEVLIAFGLINKFVKRHYGDELILRFEYWLENYASNWSHVDDLCIKTIYQFLMTRPYLIETTQHWAYSQVPWCRRACNVVWVKFIKRKIGKSIYYLDEKLVFKNCVLLIEDKDEFVQKSIGWLLKVTAVHHQQAVIDYLILNSKSMPRSTIRYATEKMALTTRKEILAMTK